MGVITHKVRIAKIGNNLESWITKEDSLVDPNAKKETIKSGFIEY